MVHVLKTIPVCAHKDLLVIDAKLQVRNIMINFFNIIFMYNYMTIILFTVMSDCDENVCKNNGTCTKHVLTLTCNCQPGYIGTFCQEKGSLGHIHNLN